ncbi:MAG: hypothetical protein R6V30_06920 [Paracoccaceae bacterium]
MRYSLALGFTVLAQPLAAQAVTECDWRANVGAIVEPWEENTRTFANGAVRVAYIDTIEPGLSPVWIAVLSPPFGVLGERQCRLIGLTETTGFADMDFSTLEAEYDAATGLRMEVSVKVVDPDSSGFLTRSLAVTLDQSTGEIDAGFAE